jgi:hypothetical protein
MSYATWVLVLCGCGGGLLPDVLRLVNCRYDSSPIPYLNSRRFWLSLALLVPLGGLASWLLDSRTPLQAVAFGYAAPELLSRVLSRGAGDGGAAGVNRGEASEVVRPREAPQGTIAALRGWWAR